MKTYMPNTQNVERKWYVVDATGIPLGRLSSQVAHILRGKHKPTFTPHADLGDHVIVLNSDHVKLTGNKLQQKEYVYHTMYRQGHKQVPYSVLMQTKSDFVVEKAVKGMLPKGNLGRAMFKKLKVYKGGEHDHQAQKPIELKLKGGN